MLRAIHDSQVMTGLLRVALTQHLWNEDRPNATLSTSLAESGTTVRHRDPSRGSILTRSRMLKISWRTTMSKWMPSSDVSSCSPSTLMPTKILWRSRYLTVVMPFMRELLVSEINKCKQAHDAERRIHPTKHLQMDHRRNELVALDLFVSLIAAVCGYVAMVGGFWGYAGGLYPLFLGGRGSFPQWTNACHLNLATLPPNCCRMNLYNTVWQESYRLFIVTCVICGVGAILLFVGFMYIIVKRKLMFITNTV